VFKAKTDQNGKYRVIDIPPGSYQVAAVAPAFVPTNLLSKNETVVLGENESVDGIDFELVRGGVITGKVVDADGRPVVEQRVNLVSADRTPKQPIVIATTSAMTDDRGVYRMFGLTAGRYKVYVGQTEDTFFTTVSGRASYKQTFHPGATDESEASVVEVNEGTEVTNVDISVGQPNQTYAVSGIVVEGESGKPVPNVRFGLQLVTGPDRNSFIGSNAASNSKGEFRIENLTPGKYGIFLTPDRNTEQSADGASFEVLDRDIEGLVIRTSRGASITGRVVLENGNDQTAWSKLTQLAVQVYVRSNGPAGGYVQRSSIGPDGSFKVTGLQDGTANINLGSADRKLLQSFSVIRIERDDVPQPRGVELKAGEQVTNLQIVVSYGTATVRGTVKPTSGELPPGTRFYLRINKPGEAPRMVQPPVVDSRGHFVIEGLAPGTYIFVVTAAGPTMTSAATARQQVQVLDGVTDVTITIDLNAKPGLSQ
jgi:protocatechuate 3,4-dioxygenase beta subunit